MRSSEPESDAVLEAARLLFASPCDFMLGVAKLEGLPPASLPEICFAGRSNVGKSSLLNALTGRSHLARVSNTPGRTQQINFFNLGQRLILADLPGYGFAQVPEKLVREWTALIRQYLRGRVPLRRVCLLIDGRHGIKETDREILELLNQSAVSTLVVLTKADKISAAQQDSLLQNTVAAIKKHPSVLPQPLLTSSETGLGMAELRAHLAELALSNPGDV